MSDLRRLILGLCLVLASRAGADTGQLREVIEADGLKVLVFTSPTPFRAGTVEVAALVTRTADGVPVTAFDLEVLVRKSDWIAERPSIAHVGTAVSGDAFSRKAMFEVETPGIWLFEVRVSTGGDQVVAHLEVEAGQPMPAWWSFLPLMVVCLICALLVLARDRLLLGRSTNRSVLTD